MAIATAIEFRLVTSSLLDGRQLATTGRLEVRSVETTGYRIRTDRHAFSVGR